MTTKNAAPPRVSYNRTIGVAAMQGRGFYYPWDSVVGSDGRLYVLGRALDGDPRGVRVTVLEPCLAFFPSLYIVVSHPLPLTTR